MPFPKKHKYGNTQITTQDGVFDSKREYGRWLELCSMVNAGEIHDLKRQVVFELIPKQQLQTPRLDKHKRRCLVEQAVNYKADFTYYDNDNNLIVEDVKGVATREYTIKRKMMLYLKGIQIKEVY